jgi:hypothetical protein
LLSIATDLEEGCFKFWHASTAEWLQGPHSEIVAQLLGLSIKAQARVLEDAAAVAAAAAAADAVSSDGSIAARARPSMMQQQVATSILEPCDVKVSMKNSSDLQDLNVDVSALQLRMSPDVMQLLMHLQQVG